MIAGFVGLDAGRIWIDGKDVTNRPPDKRDIGMVYQDYALFPHMSVFENVAFGLRMRKVSRDALVKRVHEVLEIVDLARLGDRKPAQLSGGQQQRVALARAIVIRPTMLLLDEPLSNLDARLRKHMQLELKALHRAVGLTTVHVTHDQEEALTLADTVVIMNGGRIEQIGPPGETYDRPRNRFVADFLGKSNFLKGKITDWDSEGRPSAFSIGPNVRLRLQDCAMIPRDIPTQAFIRPERIIVERAPAALAENSLSAEVEQVIYMGAVVNIIVITAEGQRLMIERSSGNPKEMVRSGDKIVIGLPAGAIRILPDA
jgi:putative spermidine/putrescine transport system ATP-binding protein